MELGFEPWILRFYAPTIANTLILDIQTDHPSHPPLTNRALKHPIERSPFSPPSHQLAQPQFPLTRFLAFGRIRYPTAVIDSSFEPGLCKGLGAFAPLAGFMRISLRGARRGVD